MEETKSKNQFLLLMSVLALLASIVIVILFVVPKISALKDLSNTAQAKEQELQNGKDKIEALKKAATVIKIARSEIETLGIAIPSKEKAEEAVSQIADAAGKAGLDIQSINASGSQEGSLTLVVASTGSFGNVSSFIGNIEKNLRPVKVLDCTISSNGEGKVDATLNIAVPFLPEPGSSATPTPEGGQTNAQSK